ncbi:DDB1- and CUL4-associated factor 10 homolog isoform X4 [Hyposmocoma kahamanoa]|uniref:DDB1- and CUL4-associated factor 10 homolog isoform X4 n=1 Tax=Hyposmocoma kahamanoa TaxID=1477025 RepID=UPI000E6DA2AB|nr:DDB1- and CUL4-associated factor 10 homolog isoform X4 [Hyposmocoma kahamanoa]
MITMDSTIDLVYGSTDNSSFMARYSAFNPYRFIRRETGFGTPLGAGDALARSLYCGMKPIASWDYEQANSLPTGGVFNLEFSPEGSLLVAACEKKSIQIFDPLTHQRIHSVNGAHSDCVNCVKFLDGRMFATCSDDTTIALWDVRNLSKKIRSLLGHSNWVKNIEFSVKDKLLVTSGLDGSIYTWDINSYTEYNLVYQRVFHASGLMRCRLSPDAKQMVMCTTGGLLVIIHDLNLSTLAQDLHGFKPNLYRLMQMSQQVIPIASMYDHLFERKRTENRVEFVSDFPLGNDAEVVSSLQVHPQGWSALSRNISHDDRSEWSCIHDIQPMNVESESSVRDSAPASPPPRRAVGRRGLRPRTRPYRAPRPHPAPSNTASPPSSSGHSVLAPPEAAAYPVFRMTCGRRLLRSNSTECFKRCIAGARWAATSTCSASWVSIRASRLPPVCAHGTRDCCPGIQCLRIMKVRYHRRRGRHRRCGKAPAQATTTRNHGITSVRTKTDSCTMLKRPMKEKGLSRNSATLQTVASFARLSAEECAY